MGRSVLEVEVEGLVLALPEEAGSAGETRLATQGTLRGPIGPGWSFHEGLTLLLE